MYRSSSHLTPSLIHGVTKHPGARVLQQNAAGQAPRPDREAEIHTLLHVALRQNRGALLNQRKSTN